mmetsp:Transcript_85118/g.237508  ORF Transcript_85118/g.237508 Transcript_85118/m.237508 type:complete len:210 (+) Transcript_85118:2166-2795(+)
MLVVPCHEEHVLAKEAMVPRENVRGEVLVSVPDVRVTIRVVDRGGNVVRIPRRRSWQHRRAAAEGRRIAGGHEAVGYWEHLAVDLELLSLLPGGAAFLRSRWGGTVGCGRAARSCARTRPRIVARVSRSEGRDMAVPSPNVRELLGVRLCPNRLKLRYVLGRRVPGVRHVRPIGQKLVQRGELALGRHGHGVLKHAGEAGEAGGGAQSP